jgi:hypothetical protein
MLASYFLFWNSYIELFTGDQENAQEADQMSDHDFGYGQLGNPGNQIANQLAALDDGAVSANFFSAVLGLNTSTISQMLQGKKTIPDAVYTMMLETLKDLADLIDKTKPLHLSFKPDRADEYRMIFRKLRQGDLFINIYDLKLSETPEALAQQRMELQAAFDAFRPQKPEPSAEKIKIIEQPVVVESIPAPKIEPAKIAAKPVRNGPRNNNFG